MVNTNSSNKFSVREQKGHAIVQLNGQVKRIDAHSYKVKSQSGDNEYDVLNTELGFICSCCDHVFVESNASISLQLNSVYHYEK